MIAFHLCRWWNVTMSIEVVLSSKSMVRKSCNIIEGMGTQSRWTSTTVCNRIIYVRMWFSCRGGLWPLNAIIYFYLLIITTYTTDFVVGRRPSCFGVANVNHCWSATFANRIVAKRFPWTNVCFTKRCFALDKFIGNILLNCYSILLK